MAKQDSGSDVPAQSQSMPGPTGENPNADVADGNQSTVQPGEGGDATSTTTGGVSVPSTGGNAAAADGGTSSSEGGTSSSQGGAA